MNTLSKPPKILIVEDGNEYFDNLSRFVPGPRYLQAHGGAHAIELLRSESGAIELIYLDMRFDRVPPETLLGDPDKLTRELGNRERALRQLAQQQGLYILQALREQAFGALPVILAYDFSRELTRFDHLSRLHPSLTWVPDAITPDEIRARLQRLLGRL